jgi:hypothetical protein
MTTTTTYYHVADPSYRIGQDLYCRETLAEMGRAPEWHWDGCDESDYAHGWAVFLLADRAEAEALRDDMLPGFQLLKITFDEWDADELVITVTENGHPYPAVAGHIPAECITAA